MATADQLNDLRDRAANNTPAYPSDTGGRDLFQGDMASHGNPDPTIRIRRYFLEGDINQGLAMLGSMLNLQGAAASDGAQGLIDTFGIPLTVTELRSVMGLNESGQPYTQNELDKVFAAGDGGDTNNDGVVNDAELGAWRPTDGRYGTNPNNQNNYSQNTLAQILRDGGVDSDGDGVFSNEEFYDYDAMRQRRDGDSYGGVTAPGDANYQDPSTWDNPPAAEVPPEQEIDNNPPPPSDDRVIPSDLANQDSLGQLLNDFENGNLVLDATGILGAVFGANLSDAMLDADLIAQVLGLF